MAAGNSNTMFTENSIFLGPSFFLGLCPLCQMSKFENDSLALVAKSLVAVMVLAISSGVTLPPTNDDDDDDDKKLCCYC